MTVSITQIESGEDFVHAVLGAFVCDIAWLIPVVTALMLLIAVFSLRQGLRPLREVSAQARRISPRDVDVRLAAERLPSELVPLARAVNQALDRLEAGIEQQRRFTANAAHQVRTPLAILKAGLDMLERNGKIQALREDVAHVNRLVDQLLSVARLDNVTLDTSQMIDLKAIATQQIGTSHRWLCRRTAKSHWRAPMCLSLSAAMRMPLGMSCAISLRMPLLIARPAGRSG